jgi:DNA-binding CsgD family transcriptional regulator
MAAALVGRDAELAALESLLAGVADGGGALLAVGDPGIGKSALAEAAGERARDRGMRVLACQGIAGEAHLPFAGLHQLLRPVLAGAGSLPAGQREALLTALGMAAGPAPAMPVVGLAALELLADAAADVPVLVVADDVHWLDWSTCEVLVFVSRRLGADAIALLATARDHELADNPLAAAGFAELRIGPLEPPAAAEVLDARARLDPVPRQRVLAEAAGNPLALVELPLVMGQPGAGIGPGGGIPLTRRLEQAFSSRLPGLADVTRTVLLTAALDDSDDLAEILAAASRVTGAAVSAADLAGAQAAGLAVVDGPAVRFRHPLVRSAVRQAASLAERQTVHRALAEVLAAVPDRSVWHRAAAAIGPDRELAAELERAAERAARRGAVAAQAEALARAAQFAPSAAQRGHLLIRAALVFHDLGQGQIVLRLLDEAEPLNLEPGDQLLLSWIRETRGADRRSGARLLDAFAELADQLRRSGDTERALDTLEVVAIRCWWSNPDPRIREHLAAVAEAVPVTGDDPRLLNILAQADPDGRAAVVLPRLASHRPGAVDAYRDYLLGFAALAVGACGQAAGFLDAAAAGTRTQGWLTLLGQIQLARSWAEVLLGRPDAATPAAAEGARLLAESGQSLWAACAQLALAVLAGRRGDAATAADLTAGAERVLLMAGVPPLLALVQLARGAEALGAGRYDQAYEQLDRIFNPGDTAYHPHVRAWALVDLADAASYAGRQDAARARLDELAPLAAATGSPLLHAGVTVAAPLLADPDDAGDPFEEALRADLAEWPLHRARLQLAYGMWLRRRRSPDARAHLRAARDTFDTAGAGPWARRARQELDATGERSSQPVPTAVDALAPQELQIARLAADGLTNRQIGQQLYLSHRTVGHHLYLIFPKLGITSRGELAAIMATA